MFVVLEGLDRAGKTTQLRLLESKLANSDIPFVSFKYPVTGPLINRFLKGEEQIDWKAASLLLAANLYELVPKIEEALNEGNWILFDRYSYSSVAYSIARGLDKETAESMTVRMPEPDLVIFLSIHEATSSERQDFGAEIFERTGFQAKVKEAFESIKKPAGWNKIEVDGMSAEKVHGGILQMLRI